MSPGWSPSCCLGDGQPSRGIGPKVMHHGRPRGEAVLGEQVNTLKSPSWDRWGVSHDQRRYQQSEQKKREINVMESRQHLYNNL